MTNIAVFGSLTEDLFVDPYGMEIMTMVSENQQKSAFVLPYGAKLTAKHVETHYGGGCANVAVALSKLGFSAIPFGAVGSDDIAQRIENNFLQTGVVPDGITTIENKKSGFALIITAFDGERTVIFHPAANILFNDFDETALVRHAPKHIHLCHLSAANHTPIRTKIQKYIAENTDVSVSWNPGKTDIMMGIEAHTALLNRCSFLFLNAEEAELFSGLTRVSAYQNHEEELRATIHIDTIADFTHIASVFLQKGVQHVVITDGRKGAMVYSVDDSFFVAPVDSPRISTLGAGDAFASGFLAGWLKRKDLHFAGTCASMLAASVVGKRGAQEGLMNGEELFL